MHRIFHCQVAKIHWSATVIWRSFRIQQIARACVCVIRDVCCSLFRQSLLSSAFSSEHTDNIRIHPSVRHHWNVPFECCVLFAVKGDREREREKRKSSTNTRMQNDSEKCEKSWMTKQVQVLHLIFHKMKSKQIISAWIKNEKQKIALNLHCVIRLGARASLLDCTGIDWIAVRVDGNMVRVVLHKSTIIEIHSGSTW